MSYNSIRPSSPSQHDPFLESPRNNSYGDPTYSKSKKGKSASTSSNGKSKPSSSHRRSVSSRAQSPATTHPTQPVVPPSAAAQNYAGAQSPTPDGAGAYQAGGATQNSDGFADYKHHQHKQHVYDNNSLSRSSTSSSSSRKASMLLFKTPQAPVTSGGCGLRIVVPLSIPLPSRCLVSFS